MKKIKLPKIDRKTKVIAIVGITLVLAGLFYQALKSMSAWYDTHSLIFAKPIMITFNRPISVVERKVNTTEIVRVVESVPEPEDLETDVEKKIFEVFGIENYRMAISVAKAESGMNCNAVNAYNSNGTADFSVFQVNSLWIKEYSLAEVADCMRNIEIAYEIWDRGDGEMGNNKGSWNPWVAARDGKHIEFLK